MRRVSSKASLKVRFPTHMYQASIVLPKECRELQEVKVASFFQAYFGPICRFEISPEIAIIRVNSQSLFMALE